MFQVPSVVIRKMQIKMTLRCHLRVAKTSSDWEALQVHDKYRREHSEPTIELSTGSPLEELEKGPKELKKFAAP